MLLTVYAGAEAYSRTLTPIDQRRICHEAKNKGSELAREDARQNPQSDLNKIAKLGAKHEG